MALSPKVLIADEPTSGLDVTLQAAILQQIRELKHTSGAGIILISHDRGVMAQMAAEVAVMYGGYIVEQADTRTLFDRPLHPYTWALMRAVPRLDTPDVGLRPLRGAPPDMIEIGMECPFLARCNKATATCRIEPMPELVEIEPGHKIGCYTRCATSSARAPLKAPRLLACAVRPSSSKASWIFGSPEFSAHIGAGLS